jgi:hypothetical protein
VGAGWFTGYMTMKLGKMAATAIGKILNSSRSLLFSVRKKCVAVY